MGYVFEVFLVGGRMKEGKRFGFGVRVGIVGGDFSLNILGYFEFELFVVWRYIFKSSEVWFRVAVRVGVGC